MNTKSNTQAPTADDDRPLTIRHGRTLFEQAKALDRKIAALQPLLQLTDAATPETEQDPVTMIVQLLEMISGTQARQDEAIAELSQKLDAIGESLVGGR